MLRVKILLEYVGHTAPKQKNSYKEHKVEFCLLMKLIIYTNQIMKEIMVQKPLNFFTSNGKSKRRFNYYFLVEKIKLTDSLIQILEFLHVLETM
jgi:hypothetical protein